MSEMGIYGITNKVNGKMYIGKSIRLESRLHEHKLYLNANSHHNQYVQRAWNKYGEENFAFKIIETVQDESILNEREIYWIEHYKAYIKDKGYNLTRGGEGVKGLEFSEEHREKLRQINFGNQNAKGYKHTKKALQIMREKKKGRKLRLGTTLSQETKQKLSEVNLGKKLSEETRKKMSKSKQGTNSYQASLNEQQVKEIKTALRDTNVTSKTLSEKYKVGVHVIYNIKAGKTYKNIAI